MTKFDKEATKRFRKAKSCATKVTFWSDLESQNPFPSHFLLCNRISLGFHVLAIKRVFWFSAVGCLGDLETRVQKICSDVRRCSSEPRSLCRLQLSWTCYGPRFHFGCSPTLALWPKKKCLMKTKRHPFRKGSASPTAPTFS